MHQVVVLLLTVLFIEPIAALSRLPGALRKKLWEWVESACVRVQDSVGSVVRLVVVSVKSLLLDIVRAAFACLIFILLPLVAAVSIVVNLMRVTVDFEQHLSSRLARGQKQGVREDVEENPSAVQLKSPPPQVYRTGE